MQTYIVHYGELGLKGQNRPQFEKRLAHNMRVALRDLGQVKVQLYRGYMAVGVADEAPPERVGPEQGAFVWCGRGERDATGERAGLHRRAHVPGGDETLVARGCADFEPALLLPDFLSGDLRCF